MKEIKLYNYSDLLDQVNKLVIDSNKISTNDNFRLMKYNSTYTIISVIYYNLKQANIVFNNLKKLISIENKNHYTVDMITVSNKFNNIIIYIEKIINKDEKIQ